MCESQAIQPGGLHAKQCAFGSCVVGPEPAHELVHAHRIIGEFLVDSCSFVGMHNVNCFFRYVHSVDVFVLFHKIWFNQSIDMSFFETLIIGRKPEFLSEASHINEEPVYIKGCA